MALSKLNEVYFSAVTDESSNYKNSITSEPVESGFNVTDNVRAEAIVFSISGVIVGHNAAQQESKLKQYRDKATICTYVGRSALSGCVIESLTTKRNSSVGNGFTFDATLRQIKVAQKTTISIDISKLKIAKKKTKKGKQAKSSKPVSPKLNQYVKVRLD